MDWNEFQRLPIGSHVRLQGRYRTYLFTKTECGRFGWQRKSDDRMFDEYSFRPYVNAGDRVTVLSELEILARESK